LLITGAGILRWRLLLNASANYSAIYLGDTVGGGGGVGMLAFWSISMAFFMRDAVRVVLASFCAGPSIF
jgi:hypothetical protein